MTMATKIVRYVASFSHTSLSPAATLQRGLTAQLRRRFISSSVKDGEAAVKVGVENRRMDASNLMNKTGPKPQVSVGDGLTADVMMSPPTGILKQTTIMPQESRPIYLDMQVTTPTDPCVLDAILPIYTGLYGNPHPRMHAHGRQTKKVIDIAREHISKLNGAHPKEITLFSSEAMGLNDMSIKYGARFYKSKMHIIALQPEHKCVLDLCRHLQDKGYDIIYLPVKNNGLINLEHLEKEIRPDSALIPIMTANNGIGVIQPMGENGKLCQKKGVFCNDGAQAVSKISVDVGGWNVDLMSISGPKAYRPKGFGVCCMRCRPKVRIDQLISGGGQERGLRSGTLAHSVVVSFGEARRIAQEEIKYTRTPEPSFPLSSICSSTVRDYYIHKNHHNKQPKQLTRALQTTSHNKPQTEKGKCGATSKDSKVDENTDNKQRNRKWATSYSKITIREAEDLLGIRLNLPGIPLNEMLKGKKGLLGPDLILRAKKEVYKGLVRYLAGAGYPTEADPDFREANINDIVVFTIYPMVELFRDKAMWALHISREKEIISKDSSISGMEEFVIMDYISHNQMKYVIVVEAKKVSLGEARKQCFLSLKDMRDCNGGGTVYGFVTMGDDWRMISYDGKFKMSERVGLLFDTMGQNKKRWLKDYSILVDCFNIALSHGGKDLGEVD